MQFFKIFLILLLLLTGIIGGGFGIREFKLPKATAGVRISAFIVVLILWVSGFASQQIEKVNFNITNNLTQGALREQVTFTIEGEKVGSITSTTDNPNSTEEFTVPKTGIYNYSVELDGVYNNNGEEASFYGQGKGVIDIESGDVFEVNGQLNNNKLTLTLVEK